MKMIKIQSLLIATTLTVVLFACRKSTNETTNTPSNSDLNTQSDDESRVSNETDAAFDDVNTAMSGQATITGSSTAAPIRYGVGVTGINDDSVKSYICDAVMTIDTVDATNNITITYNGGSCKLTRVRTGSIVISWAKGSKWTTQGATVQVKFNNLKITRVLDNKSITFNGTHTYTNVSGGSLAGFLVNQSAVIVHTITSSDMSITFDNGTQRTWNFARKRTFTYSSGLVVTTTGMHTDGTTTGISEWGTNRFGNPFTVQIVNGLVVTQACSFQLTAGELAVSNDQGSTDVVFGLDANGNATGCPVNAGTYYFKLSWTGKAGKTYTFILPY
jgi:hypothetical protein